MKVQWVSNVDAAGYVRAHVELTPDEAVVLKYKHNEYSDQKALDDANAIVIERTKKLVEPIDEVQAIIDRVGVDAILQRISADEIARKKKLYTEEKVSEMIAAALAEVANDEKETGGKEAKPEGKP